MVFVRVKLSFVTPIEELPTSVIGPAKELSPDKFSIAPRELMPVPVMLTGSAVV